MDWLNSWYDDASPDAGGVQLQSNTGQNDSSSVWGSGLLSSAIGATGQVFTTLGQTDIEKAKAKAALKSNQANAAASMSLAKIIPIAVIGLVVIVALVLFIRRK